jgi:hypothetical protein
MFSLNPSLGRGLNPVAEAVSKALSDSRPGARPLAVECRWYGGRLTDAVVHMDDGTRHAYFTGLAPEEFDEFAHGLSFPARNPGLGS